MKVKDDISNQILKVKETINSTKLSLSKMLQLRKETLKTIDEKIEKRFKEFNVIKRIQVPIKMNLIYLISTPFIYSMIFPSLLWHLGIEIYHQVCFRLYGIPLVKSKEYFVYDRQLFEWLNPVQKFNCLYCSYVNNLIRYSAEIGGRTERYWCPIKYYRRITNSHSQYTKFINKTNKKDMQNQWEELRDFSDMK